MLKTRTSKPPQQQNTTPQEAKHPGRRQRNQGGRFLAEKQTAKRSRNASARFPARSPRVFCVFFEQRRRRRSPLVVAHYQVGRSIGRRRARAQRAHHSFDGRSRCASRATRGDERKCGSSRSRPRRSQSLAAVRLARLDRRHLAAGAVLRYTFISLRKPPLRLVRTSEAGDSQPDGAPLGGTLHPPSSIPSHEIG